MKFSIETPTRAYVQEATPNEIEELKGLLTYTNTAAAHLVKRHYNNRNWRNTNVTSWSARLEELKKDVTQTLLFTDDQGLYIRPGSLSYILMPHTIENKVQYPKPKVIPWHKPLPFTLHPYQQDSVVALIKEYVNGPANVELTTGSGKSAILLKVYRETGFKTVVIAPSKSIFNELIESFEHHFGKGKVGKFGDSKKVLGKNITIAIGDSICNVKPGTPEWDFFSTVQMFEADESHTWGAETLDQICHGVLANVPIRLFFSATQTRGDGAERLLQSIIGKTVHTLTTADAVAGGYICDHDFRVLQVESSHPGFASGDALEMKRIHFLGNKNIAAFIAKLANADALINKRQSLILVEELSQIAAIVKLLKVPVAYAHSEAKKDRLLELGLEKVDPAESVEAFNKGEVMVLVGTSCIATGTNIFPTHNTFNFVGGSSEIKTKQGSVGRSVRKMSSSPYKNPCAPKDKATIWDFNVSDVPLMVKHLKERIRFYKDSGTEIKFIKL